MMTLHKQADPVSQHNAGGRQSKKSRWGKWDKTSKYQKRGKNENEEAGKCNVLVKLEPHVVVNPGVGNPKCWKSHIGPKKQKTNMSGAAKK